MNIQTSLFSNAFQGLKAHNPGITWKPIDWIDWMAEDGDWYAFYFSGRKIAEVQLNKRDDVWLCVFGQQRGGNTTGTKDKLENELNEYLEVIIKNKEWMTIRAEPGG